MKIALAMIVAAKDSEAELLDRCLSFVHKHVDGLFITITGENEAVFNVCRKYNAIVSRFEWINDFAQARNYNFAQVPSEFDYILWLDADDVLRGAEKLKKTIEANPSDVYTLNYLYAFDENRNPSVVHLKSQIVKNDGCVEWHGALHEDFKANRQVSTHFIKGIERLHLKTEDGFNEAKERNLTVAKAQLENKPEDPRSHWNIANASSALGRYEEALDHFASFVSMSESDDEKYIARLRMAEANWAIGKRGEAIDQTRYAIGYKPEYPDAYYLSGKMLNEMKQQMKASEMYLQGLSKKPPVYSIIVYNPRDYDYNPMLELARIFLSIERPDLALPLFEACNKIVKSDNLTEAISEAKLSNKLFQKVIKHVKKLENIEDRDELKKELDKLPKEISSHPTVCLIRNRKLIKEESSGKDLVFYCGLTARKWTPEAIKEGIGGSEEAVIYLSERLADKGWNVTVYNNCGHKELKFGKVTYKPFWSWNYRDKQDVVILWRSPMAAQYDINCPNVYVDLHDTIPAGEFTADRLKRISKIFVKSHFHRSLYPDVQDDKFVIIPNGILSKEFTEKVEKDRYLMINTSSPDRSLSALCKVYKLVKMDIPEAKCQWAYGWGVFDTAHSGNPKKMEWKAAIEKQAKEAGIESLGMVSHERVKEMYLKANIFAYPSEFAEIDCISLTKAMAGGATPVTTDFAAMGEKQGQGGVFIKSEKTKDTWNKPFQYDFALQDNDKIKEIAKNIINIMKNPIDDRSDMRKWAQNSYDWGRIVDSWDKELCTRK